MSQQKLTQYLIKELDHVPNVRERAERLYLPLYFWCLDRIAETRPVIIGLNGPQGSGKSTLTRVLCDLLELEDYRAATISIDDFYLTHEEQVRLARENPNHPYLQSRGYPGTHDIALGTQTLTQLKETWGEAVIPRYEKSLFDGQGDRLPPSAWKQVSLPLDCIFFEGWMLGFRPVEQNLIRSPKLTEINRRLQGYESWNLLLDAFIQLKPQKTHWVVDWRIEAEKKMKEAGKSGMSDSEIKKYVETFLPAYELYLPELSPPLLVKGKSKVVKIGRDRMPIGSV